MPAVTTADRPCAGDACPGLRKAVVASAREIGDAALNMLETAGGVAAAFLVLQVAGLLAEERHGGFSARVLGGNLAWLGLAFALVATAYVLFMRFTP